jgi:hypothetical protein
MTAPGQYAAQDGSFARSAGGAAGRGIVLIAIAVVIGLVLLAKGFDGADSVAGSADVGDTPADEPATDDGTDEPATDDGTDEPATDDGTDEPADGTDVPSDDTGTEPDAPRPASEVKVAAVNATGAPGVAGRATGILDTQGYITQAKNAVDNLDVSAVYYQAGYAEDAKAVAAILQIPADLIGPAPADVVDRVSNSENVADFHVFIFQGADGLAGV